MKRVIFLITIAAYFILLFISRHPLIIDDVHPGVQCDALLKKADVLYVIPFLEDAPLTDEWCTYLRSLNKTVGLHGITHTKHEFSKNVNDTQLSEATTAFEKCLGYKPELFRPPYNSINEENKKKVEHAGMTVYSSSYIMHPYCHCYPYSYMKPLNWLFFC